jgi:hypothetical protein
VDKLIGGFSQLFSWNTQKKKKEKKRKKETKMQELDYSRSCSLKFAIIANGMPLTS